MTNLKSTHADLFGIQTRMMNDSTFKALSEANGLPWDPAAGYYPRWYNGPAPEDTRVLFFMAEPGAVHPGEEDALAINHEDVVHSWAFTKPACNQRRAHESWRSTADEIARRIRKLDAVEAESASRSPRSLRRPHTAESGACQLGPGSPR